MCTLLSTWGFCLLFANHEYMTEIEKFTRGYEIDRIIETTVSVLLEKGFPPEIMDEALTFSELYDIDFLSEERFDCFVSSCYGLWEGPPKFKMTIANNSCLANSSLAHELIHFFVYHGMDYQDPGHKDPELFNMGCIWKYPPGEGKPVEQVLNRLNCMMNTAESIIKDALQQEICG